MMRQKMSQGYYSVQHYFYFSTARVETSETQTQGISPGGNYVFGNMRQALV